jgi:hypothetical protein
MTTKAAVTQKTRALTYLNQDFEGFKQDIVNNHIKVYFPTTYQDFNESSLGMMLVEMMAYVGDSLSFYLDKKFAESFLSTAQERTNIFKHAKQLGFRAFGKTSAFGRVNLMISVPAITINQQILPDMRYAGIVYQGAQVKSTGGQTFETLEDADFARVDITDPALVVVSKTDPSTKAPLSFGLLLRDVPIKAGQTKTVTLPVGAYKSFLQLQLPDPDVLEVLSVVDSLGNIWYEVDYLAQDTVFDGVPNTGADATDVPYVLMLRTVPYRFVSELDTVSGFTFLVFGTGDGSATDFDLIPNLGDLSIPTYGKQTFTDYTIDPQNFLRTRTLGLAPINTSLTVKYRVGGGVSTNAGAATIITVTNANFDVGNSTLPVPVVRDVKNSLSVINTEPAQGGRDELSVGELKQLISANFAAQARAVTIEDYIARTLSMPSKFGSVFRAFAQPGQINRNSVELAVLAKDSNDNVTLASPTLKSNLQTYISRFRLLTDSVELLDGEIINIGVNFSLLVSPDYNRSQVLTNCLNALRDYFVIDKWQISQPLVLTDLNYLLADQDGVLSVYQVSVVNLAGFIDGRNYSATTYNIAKATANGIIYCPKNAIFAVAFPSRDLIGTAK